MSCDVKQTTSLKDLWWDTAFLFVFNSSFSFQKLKYLSYTPSEMLVLVRRVQKGFITLFRKIVQPAGEKARYEINGNPTFAFKAKSGPCFPKIFKEKFSLALVYNYSYDADLYFDDTV